MSPRSVAIVCTAHGFGHVSRQLVVAEELRRRGIEPTLFCAAPSVLVHEYLPDLQVVPWSADVGLVQHSGLQEDIGRTLDLLADRCSEASIDALADRLVGYDRVLVDIAPTALEAARRAGCPALAVGNFDWAWIYSHFPPLQAWSERFAAWQAPHPSVFLRPGPGLYGFACVHETGLVARTRPPRSFARDGERTVLVAFGGFGLADAERYLPQLAGVRYLLSPPMEPLHRDDCHFVEGVAYPALVAGADAVFTKPGYGIVTECFAAGTPIAWLDRGAFPEAPFMEEAMWARGDEKVEQGLGPALERLWTRPRPQPLVDSGAREVVDRLLQDSLLPPSTSAQKPA